MKATFVAFDLETTGLEPESCDIIEVGGQKFSLEDDGTPKYLSSFSSLVKIDGCVPAEATKINHITDDMLVDAPPEAEVVRKFFSWAGLSSILLAHNASFDVSFLGNAIHRHALMLPRNPVFCSKRMACKLFPESGHTLTQLEKNLLTTEAGHKWLEQKDDSLRHRALYDCQLLAHVFAGMVKKRIPKADWEAERIVKILPTLGGERIRFDRPLNSEELRMEYDEMKWRMA